MVVVIQRFHCIQLPEIAIIGVGNSPTTYFVHAQQVVGLLLNKASRRAAASAMHAFFKSEEGKRMEHGGDLSAAFMRGPLNAMIYTHRLSSSSSTGGGGGSPSHFVTLEGLKEIMKNLPNQDESVKQNNHSLFEECLDQMTATNALQPATQEQCANDYDDLEVVSEEPFAVDDDSSCKKMMPHMLFRCFQNQTAAEKTLLEERIKIEQERTMMEKERTAMEKERADLKLEAERSKFQAERAEWERERLVLLHRQREAQPSKSNQGPRAENHSEANERVVPQKRALSGHSHVAKAVPVAKFLFLVRYDAVSALVPENFTIGVVECESLKLDNHWLTLLRVGYPKKRLPQVVVQLKALIADGLIRKAWIENSTPGNDDESTYTLSPEDIHDDEAGITIKHYVMKLITKTGQEHAGCIQLSCVRH